MNALQVQGTDRRALRGSWLRPFHLCLTCLLVVGGGKPSVARAAEVVAVRADDFLNSLGVGAAVSRGGRVWRARSNEDTSGFLSDALAKYRLLTGDTPHDALLRTDAFGYVRHRLTGDRAPLESALRRNAEAFRSNWEAYTSEMRWTDRVMAFTRNYLNHVPEPVPRAPSPDILYKHRDR